MDTDKTKTDTDIIIEGPKEINLDGRQYIMRRLEVRDVYSYAKLFTAAMVKTKEQVGMEAILAEGDAAAGAMTSFFEAYLDNPEGFARIFGPVIGITATEFLKLSPKAFSQFLDELDQQQDMAAFFDAAMRLMKIIGSASKPQ